MTNTYKIVWEAYGDDEEYVVNVSRIDYLCWMNQSWMNDYYLCIKLEGNQCLEFRCNYGNRPKLIKLLAIYSDLQKLMEGNDD